MDAVDLFSWLSQRTDVLHPARFAVFALAGLLCAWWARKHGAALSLCCQNALRARAWGPPARGDLADLAEDTPVVLRGTLVLEDDRLFLRVDGRLVRLTGALTVEDDGRRMDVDAVRRRAREGAEALVRGRVRHERDDDDATYRATPRRGVLKPDGEVVRVVILKAVPNASDRCRAVALGALLGGVVGATLPVLLAASLGPARCLPRVSWRVALIAPRYVRIAPTVHRATERRCDVATGILGPWWPEESTRRPSDVVVQEGAAFDAVRAALPLAPIALDRERALWEALGERARVLDFDVRHGDAAALRSLLRNAYVGRDGRVVHRALFRLASLEPLGEWLPRVITAFLSHEDGDEGPGPEAALRQLSPDDAVALRCLRLAGVRPAVESWRVYPMQPLPGADQARAMLAMDAPACRILGALAPSQRGDTALRALSALPRTSPTWRPLIDAARNVILLEGVVSGRVHVGPRQSDAYGDPEEQRATLPPGIAMQIEHLGDLAQLRGHLWLVDRTRLPALEALAETYMASDPTAYRRVDIHGSALTGPLEQKPADARWTDYADDGYRLALRSFDDARQRDPRFDEAWRRELEAGRDRVRRIVDQRQLSLALRSPEFTGPWLLREETWRAFRMALHEGADDPSLPTDPGLDVARLTLVLRALHAADRRAVVGGLGPVTRRSVRVALIAWALGPDVTRPWLAEWATPAANETTEALRARRFLGPHNSAAPPWAVPVGLWRTTSRPEQDRVDGEFGAFLSDRDDPFVTAILEALELSLRRASRPPTLPSH